MDVFSRTFLPATSEAGLPIPVVSRHMPVLRRCVAREETTVLVNRAQRPGGAPAWYVLLLTNRHLVISRESRLLHRVQLHLAAGLRELTDAAWTPYERAGIALSMTASDGVQERLWLPIREPRRLRQVDALLGHAFRCRTVTALPPRSRLAGLTAA
jgi:hypothetical protein